MWGTEAVIDEARGKITITTARFDPTDHANTGMLCANRSVWKISDTDMKAKIVGIKGWTAVSHRWEPSTMAVPASHRAVLATILMERWDKGKLRGRIDDGS
jgi:hypothetical protein